MISNKQTKQLVSIKNMLEIATYLSDEYIDNNAKGFNIDNLTKKGIIYKLFCSNMFNLIDTIDKAKYLFEEFKEEYDYFQGEINKKFVSSDSKYYTKVNEEITLFKVLGEMRHELNHFEKVVNDKITMFEIEIKFDDVENVRKICEGLINKKYNIIEYDKIKGIILSRPKILYEKEKIENAVTKFEEKISVINMKPDYKEDMNMMVNTFGFIFSPDFVMDLLNKKPEAINDLNLKEEQLENMSIRYDIEILKCGTADDIRKYNNMKVLVEKFKNENESVSLEEYKFNMEELIKQVVVMYTSNLKELNNNEE